MKIVINNCFGGFSLSPLAVKKLAELQGKKCLFYELDPEDRRDKFLIQVVEELGYKADGISANLKIVEIPDGIDYTIEEYDGKEHIAESHRTWY